MLTCLFTSEVNLSDLYIVLKNSTVFIFVEIVCRFFSKPLNVTPKRHLRLNLHFIDMHCCQNLSLNNDDVNTIYVWHFLPFLKLISFFCIFSSVVALNIFLFTFHNNKLHFSPAIIQQIVFFYLSSIALSFRRCFRAVLSAFDMVLFDMSEPVRESLNALHSVPHIHSYTPHAEHGFWDCSWRNFELVNSCLTCKLRT